MILPWNLAREIAAQLAYTQEWGAQLIVPIPTATVLEPPESRLTTSRCRPLLCGACRFRRDRRREGRDLLRRPRRAHGRGDAAHPEADDRDRRQADPLAHHALLRDVGAQRVHPLPRLQGRGRSRSTSSPTTRRCSTTSCSSGTARTARSSSCSRATSTSGGSRSSTPGSTSTIGERLKAVEPYLGDDETFLATYGDGLTDAPLPTDRRVPREREDGDVPLGAPAVQRASRLDRRRRHRRSRSRT